MKVTFLLHLYQPSVQTREVFDKVYAESYNPLLKLIKHKRNLRLTLSLPFSLLEQMDRFGYSTWIESLKELVDQGRVEITGGSAYHALLPKLNEEFFIQQVLLNEYGLGYFFGRRSGFEGESAVMIKDLDGFYPPELAVSVSTVKLLSELSYNWILVDENALFSIPTNDLSNNYIFRFKELPINIVRRNTELSNMLSFKRDDDISDLVSRIKDSGSCVIALDGEYFGHHYRDGINLFDNLIDTLTNDNTHFLTMSDFVESFEPISIDSLNESTWGATREDMSEGLVYPMWDQPDNVLHRSLWKLQNYVMHNFKPSSFTTTDGDLGNLPIWNDSGLSKLSDPETVKSVKKDLALAQCMASDKFWWASKESLPNEVYLYSPKMILKGIDPMQILLDLTNDANYAKVLEECRSLIVSELKSDIKDSENITSICT